jgi:hypothetical protein
MTTPKKNEGNVGRPRVEVPADRSVALRDAGRPWRAIAKALGLAVTTVHRAYHATKGRSTPSQNSGKDNE